MLDALVLDVEVLEVLVLLEDVLGLLVEVLEVLVLEVGSAGGACAAGECAGTAGGGARRGSWYHMCVELVPHVMSSK